MSSTPEQKSIKIKKKVTSGQSTALETALKPVCKPESDGLCREHAF